MTAPLVPYSTYVSLKRFVDGNSYRWFEKSVQGFKQRMPYNVNTEYTLRIFESAGPTVTESLVFNQAFMERIRDEATNRARGKFVDMIGSSSSFGATMTAELKTTWGTVVSGVTNILQAAMAVSRGNLPKAAKILGFSPPVVRKRVKVKRFRGSSGRVRAKYVNREHWVMPSGRLVAKSAANKWLWYSYGIKPLVSDIHNGMDVLTRPHPAMTRVTAYASSNGVATRYSAWSTVWRDQSKVAIKIQADVSVRNPNLWLANQLGLVNPVQMFNEGIPFSFVIDWFSNLSQIIMQMTDFVGLEIANPVTSEKYYHKTAYDETYYPGGVIRINIRRGYTRRLVIPSARFRFAYEVFKWDRGANAISLLVGFLPKVWR